MPKFIDEKDCSIERDNKYYPDKVVLLDDEGNLIFSEPSASWTDKQVREIVQYINRFYNLGYMAGRDSLRADLKSLIGI
ncbi:hypothetical protein C4588_06095 [Candidatus Parcubacteria bacterium]|nr:MAG: hypothetical protein C4588_06095 [Candidatus Parcubacteria bacterium]